MRETAIVAGTQPGAGRLSSCRWALHEPGVPPMGVDFRVFWSASYLSLHDSPIAAFDLLKIVELEDSMFPGRYAPWVYPPTFQLLVHPLALLPYALSYVSSCVVGIPLWIKCFEAASWFNATVTENASGGVVRAMPSVFATVRRLGGSGPVAYAVHAAVAIPVMLVTLRLWTRSARFEVKAAAAVIATLMIQPYILHYDLAWLLLPIVYLCHDRATRDAWTNREPAIVCLAWCLPLLSLLPSYFPAILQPGVLVLPALFVVTIAPPAYRGLFAHRARWTPLLKCRSIRKLLKRGYRQSCDDRSGPRSTSSAGDLDERFAQYRRRPNERH
ncbi:hypothetical protein [Pandoraea sp. SD6-2]|uniref:hypothetical protein n=1 Tax=Pandoraea sp. SD6-2 TaxID=1286093 RepID=UPI0011846D37|nr:hypothetical protein [Pandoraea sp. SD6-2]